VDSGFCSGLVTEPSSPAAEGSGGGEGEEEEELVGDCPSVEDASNIIIPKCQNCQKCKVRLEIEKIRGLSRTSRNNINVHHSQVKCSGRHIYFSRSLGIVVNIVCSPQECMREIRTVTSASGKYQQATSW
jgi:hypothetical protein